MRLTGLHFPTSNRDPSSWIANIATGGRVTLYSLQLGHASRSARGFKLAGWISSGPAELVMFMFPRYKRTISFVICKSSMFGGGIGRSSSLEALTHPEYTGKVVN